MKHCEGFVGICLVCHVYVRLVLGCVFVFFWMCRVVVRLRVCFSVLCWSVLLHGMLSLLRVSFSLCVHVPASGDVISGVCVVPDQCEVCLRYFYQKPVRNSLYADSL